MPGNNYGSGSLSFDKLPEAIPVNKKAVRLKGLMLLLTILFFVLMCVMAIVIASRNKSYDTHVIGPGPIWKQKPLPGSSQLCLSPQCVRQAAEFTQFMDDSVPPCANFYQYACGTFTRNAKNLGLGDLYSVKTQMENVNYELAYAVLENDIVGDANTAEYKAKRLNAICNNDFDNTLTGGQQIGNTLNDLGGLDLLGTFDITKFDLSQVIIKSHNNYATKAFFTIGAIEDPGFPTKKIFQISRSGLGISNAGSYLNPLMEHNKIVYKELIRTVMKLIVRDSGKTTTAEMVEQYVTDVLLVETDLAKAYQNSPAVDPEVVLLKDWELKFGLIKWREMLSDILGKENVTDATRIYSTDKKYAEELNIVLNLINDKRVYHHYITWMVILDYIEGLGWEYVQAYREFQEQLINKQNFPSRKQYCRELVDSIMPFALDNLFISKIFNQDNLIQIKVISHMLDQVYPPMLSRWMVGGNDKTAKDKLEAISKKLGYPDWLKNSKIIDKIYSQLEIDEKDFYLNLINAAMFKKSQIRDAILSLSTDYEDWNIDILKPIDKYDQFKNEIIYSAGVLRPPFYGKDNMGYLNFGSVGASLSNDMASSFIYPGNKYDVNGVKKEWWSKETSKNYADYEDCLAGRIPNKLNVKQNDGSILEVPVNQLKMSKKLSQELYAVDMALHAYQTAISGELPIPGLKYSNGRQLFMIAYAQSHCQYYKPDTEVRLLKFSQPTSSLRVNLLATNSARFQMEFGCLGVGGRPRPPCAPFNNNARVNNSTLI